MTEREIEERLKNTTPKQRVAAVVWYFRHTTGLTHSVDSLCRAVVDAADELRGWEHIAPAWLDGVEKSKRWPYESIQE